MSKRLAHGGDPSIVETEYGRPEGGWLDLSTGINPVPYPVGEIDIDVWHRLPRTNDLQGLLNIARSAYGISKAAGLVAAPGTQAIIQYLPRLFPERRVAVVGPTYGEHAHCWRQAGHAVRDVRALEATEDSDIAIVVNPNNPDGREITPDDLIAFAERMAAKEGLLIVDEAFADSSPEISVCDQTGHPGLIVLRSFGKFYGLAGARLGFAACTPDLASTLEEALGPWAVPGPTIALADRALADHKWRAETLIRLDQDAHALDGVLMTAGLNVVGGTTLFRLCKTKNAALLFAHLARDGILVRIFDDNQHHVRFGLPADSAGLQRLSRSLATFSN